MSKNAPSNLQETQNKNEEVKSQEDYGQAISEKSNMKQQQLKQQQQQLKQQQQQDIQQ
jgi:hypothetical protein